MTALISPRPLTGRTVLIGLIAFFGLIATVNGIFIFFALESWPGLSQQDPYKVGIDYNRVLDEARTQKALGWRSGVDLGSDGGLTVRIANAAGSPIADLVVTATLKRPASAERDEAVSLAREPDGAYRARVALPLAGAWLVEVSAIHADGRRYRMVHEILVRP